MAEVEVEFDYTAEQPDELSIKKGDIVTNVLMVEGGWWEGDLNGKKGMFPDNFVKVIRDPAKEVVKREVPKKEDPKVQASKRQSVKDLANKIKAQVPDGPIATRKKDQSVKKKRAKVIYSYTPENDDEIKLEVGDSVEILAQEEEGWCEGIVNGKTGMFPSNFVEISEEDDTAITETAEPKETESKLIQGKKITGVGFGNIFGSGPIKLRSADGPTSAGKHSPATEKSHEKVQEKKAPERPAQRRSKEETLAPPVDKAVVRYSYAAENDDELSLEEGLIVTVLDKDLEDSGWWKGELNGKTGVFPDNFVEMIKEEPKPKKPPPPAAAPAPKHPPKLPDKAPVAEQRPEVKEEKTAMQTPSIPTKKHPGHPPPPIGKKPHKPAEPHKPTEPPHKPAETHKPTEPHKPAEPHKVVEPHKAVEPHKPADTTHAKTVEEEKHRAEPVSGASSFESVEPQGEKLVHLTASRPKGPSKRPPSQVFFQNPKIADIKEEERNGDVKDSHWLKEEKHPASRTSPITEKKEEHKEKPQSAPARPPDPMVSAAATASLHSAIEELRREMHDMKQNTVSKAAFTELKSENEHLKKELDNIKHNFSRRIKDVMGEVDEEKKLRLMMQVEVERIQKLVSESHV